jgi:hypothetical protein
MSYSILFLEHDRVTHSISWDMGLEAASRYARSQLADPCEVRVEIWDEADVLVFRHPPSAGRRPNS